jgi:hypothetical protein
VGLACSSSSTAPSTALDASTSRPDSTHAGREGGAADSSLPRADGAARTDATTPKDAALHDAMSAVPEAGATCDAATATFTCTGDGDARFECTSSGPVQEACPNGCLREPAGQDSTCMGTTSNWSCTGAYGTTPVDDGNYYLTEFGCWVDDAGTHTDPDDNCIPSCLAKAQAAGLCDPGGAGPDCEEKLSWYTADGARFGCLQRLRVTNPATGKAVIAIALDYGPGCTGENDVQHAVLDASGLVNDYLFGSAQGRSDMALVHVVEVDDSTPLGPVP